MLCFVLEKILTHVKQVVRSGPAFCSCSQLLKLKFSYQQENLLLKDSPVALPKSIKNPTEIDGMKNANVSNITSNASSELHLHLFGQLN